MTEDEAKTRWCPFAKTTLAISEGPSTFRYAEEAPSAHNRVGFDFASGRTPMPVGPCIGSLCMAWRWGKDREVLASITEIAGAMREHGLGPLDATAATSRKVQDGFCGLAGAPQ